MSHPTLRRALAVLTLTFATALAAAPEAGAAVHTSKTGAAHARAAQKARAPRKAGIQIDPWGLVDSLVQIIVDGRG